MHLTSREFWTVVHGMVLGALFLVAFSGGLAELWNMRVEWVTAAGIRTRTSRLVVGTVAMAVAGWLTVYAGTYIVYPWYRAPAPKPLIAAAAAPTASESDFRALENWPRNFLLIPARQTAEWHNFGMEWKEHIAFLCPILATAVAFVVVRYRRQLHRDVVLRRALLTLFVLAFASAAIAGTLGAFINKAAPIR
jgi:hypothetical protein